MREVRCGKCAASGWLAEAKSGLMVLILSEDLPPFQPLPTFSYPSPYLSSPLTAISNPLCLTFPFLFLPFPPVLTLPYCPSPSLLSYTSLSVLSLNTFPSPPTFSPPSYPSFPNCPSLHPTCPSPPSQKYFLLLRFV